MTTFNEDTLSEKPAIEQLKRMGYEFIPGDKLDPQENEDSERSSRRDVVLVNRLRAKLVELNPDASEGAIDKAIRRVTNIQGTGILDENRTFHHDLVSNISIDQETDAGRRGVTIKFIDFDHPEMNEFLVVNQFWVKGHDVYDRPDIVIFVNGIPLVVIECKSPVAKETGTKEALDQLIRYQKEIPALFRTNQILIGINLFGAKYGVIGASQEDFHEWKAKPEEKLPILRDHPMVKEMLELKLIDKNGLSLTPAAQDVLIAVLLNKKNLLDIIRNFILFDTKNGMMTKKITRYQQFTAVLKIVNRILHEKEKKGIIWHWQGSGKSLTMLFTALKLRREEALLQNPYILVITDRKYLDRQISDTFRECGFPNPIRAENSKDLYHMLSEGVGRTIMTTVQKFRTMPDKPLSTAKNIIVLTDEAHRTQYGSFSIYLGKALPHASIFAFTGTPLDKRGRNTYRVFSPHGERYLDRYTIFQSEQDRTTVPIKYMSRMAELRIIGSSLDSLLSALFPGKTKKELAALKKQFATRNALTHAPQRIERIALDIVKHYNQVVRPDGFKAMLVAESRDAVVKYKNALDRLIDPGMSAVVMTINEKEDPDEWKEKYFLTEKDEDTLKGRFMDPDEPLSIFIVCDKLLAGFDAPILQAMYLDSRLREHNLLQAVARTDRPYPRKNFGLVVDYIGVGTELLKALEMFNAEDLVGLFNIDDVEKELVKLKDHHKAAIDIFSGIPLDGDPKEVIQKCMDVLSSAKLRDTFNGTYRAFAGSMDFLMPDVRVAPYIKDFKFLGLIREAARNLYRDESLRMDDLGRRIEALIHAHVVAEGIEDLLKPLIISSSDFTDKLKAKGSDKAQAVHLEYAIRDEIQEHAAEDPVFYESLQKQLETLIESQKKERKDDAEVLRSLMQIKDKEARKDADARKYGLDGSKEFAFFGLIGKFQKAIPLKTEEEMSSLAKKIIEILEKHAVVEWTDREDIQKEMRRDIKRVLRAKGCTEKDLPHVVREFMEIGQRWVKR